MMPVRTRRLSGRRAGLRAGLAATLAVLMCLQGALGPSLVVHTDGSHGHAGAAPVHLFAGTHDHGHGHAEPGHHAVPGGHGHHHHHGSSAAVRDCPDQVVTGVHAICCDGHEHAHLASPEWWRPAPDELVILAPVAPPRVVVADVAFASRRGLGPLPTAPRPPPGLREHRSVVLLL